MPYVSQTLVVDDSRSMRSILSGSLARNGSAACQATDGREALAALQEEVSDLSPMCVNYNMPNMNAVELARFRREHEQFAHVPVVVITTATTFSSMQQAFEAGVNEYVMERFTAKVVIDKPRVIGTLAN